MALWAAEVPANQDRRKGSPLMARGKYDDMGFKYDWDKEGFDTWEEAIEAWLEKDHEDDDAEHLEEWESVCDDESESTTDRLRELLGDDEDELVGEVNSHCEGSLTQASVEAAEELARRKQALEEGDEFTRSEYVDKARDTLRTVMDRDQETSQWYDESRAEIDWKCQTGRLDDYGRECALRKLSDEYRRRSLGLELAANDVPLDDLGDTAWEAQPSHLFASGYAAEEYEKLRELRRLLKSIPHHRREEAFREACEEFDVPDEAADELWRDWIGLDR